MKKYTSLLVVTLISIIGISGCYTDAIDSLSSFKFQLPIIFRSNHDNKTAPDTSLDFSNLYDYKEYRDNEGKINSAEILHFNYWIDSLVFDNGTVFDPEMHNIEFEFIRFYLQFAMADGLGGWKLDPNAGPYLLGEFNDVNVKDYFRYAHNILLVPEETATIISKAIKDRPQFYIITEYSKTKDQTGEKRSFPHIRARYDIVIRFDVDL